MKFLNIIRHSESETNSKDDFLRTLNEEGIKDAINLDNYLKFLTFLCSKVSFLTCYYRIISRRG